MLKAYSEMDHEKICQFLSGKGCDWIQWTRNPPYASHMGGVWERMIRTVRSIFNSLLADVSGRLNCDALMTFMCEAEAIVNSRPLATANLNDYDSEILTPNHLLTMKTKPTMGPPGVFDQADVYCRRRWRVVQHLSNQFWIQWKRQYLSSILTRPKWRKIERNFAVGDIVLVKDEDTPRNVWPLGRVTEVFPSKADGLVRSVLIKTRSSQELKRPISKLVFLLEGSAKAELPAGSVTE